jgi:hypothetical protein
MQHTADTLLDQLQATDPDIFMSVLLRVVSGYHETLHWYAQHWHTGE